MVSVDYGDLLHKTLPYNVHHFDEVMVVTTPWDTETIEVVERLGEMVYTTEAFYDDGAHFNKWKALEEALWEFEPKGLMCIMDADVRWPRKINNQQDFERGCLYTPRRRLHIDVTKPIPPEEAWNNLRLFQEREFAGYTQIFHADDPHLPELPWHQTDWIHAGGADSFFQQLWPEDKKIRPNWEVLHLGFPGVNWCGRCSVRIDGTKDQRAAVREEALAQIAADRRATGGYASERLRTGG